MNFISMILLLLKYDCTRNFTHNILLYWRIIWLFNDINGMLLIKKNLVPFVVTEASDKF